MSNEGGKKLKPFELVLQKELLDLDPIDGVQLHQVDEHSLKEIALSVTPKESYFRGKTVSFVILFKDTYPIAPPKITCQSKIFHPNIDERGNVCLNVLKLDWNPIINLQMLILGLLLLLNVQMNHVVNPIEGDTQEFCPHKREAHLI
ncbi:ubiquitin-conjugating enzyme E2 [Plasmodium vivax India VII]|uniref:Ubiquitin-conjugating enzyme E2, putative n=5 Tax=Plasmodium vivax TaxID=5855 RepID=A5K8V5_PLAVS|nr:ubiquitin-conjugating enzyme E2, putative [Plasmodium vivax]KMZ77536.1 ubiquitin-conjugating enzyme E2 [Plasmodium vivax India VII]KMZ84697.1 ubiquitin-conjugating enzyme E2 [Plasmodium vivax Brazil I]KMZ89975.1 ubiquitin-conjugating enzyme E2 [Plasmodium vivax Mauritania I]KMZ96531.1 ubiquitin-conjugating enzyme E2 [Plasmodium vivax North Korean]EDL44251.1 ubiquitin-conjugating enzyme E2, putative [Plasmodium vivax]|eukprot:XP_001613978.1 ubiquitin-conjugating enzyme E2 [Plasmodium vivax Sal-1]